MISANVSNYFILLMYNMTKYYEPDHLFTYPDTYTSFRDYTIRPTLRLSDQQGTDQPRFRQVRYQNAQRGSMNQRVSGGVQYGSGAYARKRGRPRMQRGGKFTFGDFVHGALKFAPLAGLLL